MKTDTTTGRWKIGALVAAAGAGLTLASIEPASAGYDPTDPPIDLPGANEDGTISLTPAQIAQMMAARGGGGGGGGAKQGDFPAFSEVSDGYEQVVSTADGQSYFNIWTRDKDAQMLAELPRGYENKKMFIATTVGSGETYAGLQVSDMYVYWRRYNDRLALIMPNVQDRSTGDPESQQSVKRIFTDRVLLDVPIVSMGPNNQPVIDMDELLLGSARLFFGNQAAGMNARLAKISKAKAFPQNVELAFEVPAAGGVLRTFHYSISDIPARTGYKPREADERVGYFTTVYRDLGQFDNREVWTRYINRWNLEKRDPSLKVSPPKEPIVFYVDAAAPVRYRRWIKQGVEYWNRAFLNVGIDGAIEVRFQDAQTGAHMDKDPEDVRYNFIRWLSNAQGTAIGPSRVHPETGQILDADIVLTDGFIRSYFTVYNEYIPEAATENFGPDTLAWLEENPNWDPRLRAVSPAEARDLQAQRQARGVLRYGGHPAAQVDGSALGDDLYDGLADRLSQTNGLCMVGHGKSVQMAMFRMHRDIADSFLNDLASGEQPEVPEDLPPEVLEMIRKRVERNPELLDQLPEHIKAKLGYGQPEKDEDEAEDGEAHDQAADEGAGGTGSDDDSQLLDGIPEEFAGPMLADLVAHEVGHTLGLRHNFRASSAYTIDEINSEGFAGNKTITGSVMDYTGINIRMESGDQQGDYAMIDIGPYDMWAIEYGYTFGDPAKVLERVNEPELTYATDEDTWGPDPLATRWDLGADPINYAREYVRLSEWVRGRILDDFVEEGESWSRARRGYELSLGLQTRTLGFMSRWVGGSYILRDKKGDAGDRVPVMPVEAEKQREALSFVIEHSFYDDAFGLDPEILRYMTNDRWWDAGGMSQIFNDPAWPVHDRIMGIQASVLTMLMNPTTLQRVFDNEIRSADIEENPVTLPEVFGVIKDAAWSELDQPSNGRFTATDPMISSLRRNLQREHLTRLIDLSFMGGSGGAAMNAVANLATMQLRDLHGNIGKLLEGRQAANLDPYSRAHLTEAHIRIAKALDAQYIYNAGSMGGGVTNIIIGQPANERNAR
ncbi:MAG: zinc-dependent metalloprotease [Phycisphaerales bacterium JB037]